MNPSLSLPGPETLRRLARRPGRAGHFSRAAIVGVLAGFIAVAFQTALACAEATRERLLTRLHALPHAACWAWVILPAIGLVVGCLIGYAVRRLAPDAPGSGIPHVKGVLLQVRVMRWKWLLPVKFIGGVLGVGAGLSLGREGPTVQMGAAAGQLVADVLGLPPRLVPQLVSCGAGAGLAAAFNAPLAGFLFVLEELHREMSALTFGGALVAALIADVITRSLTGQLPSFSIKGYPALPLSALALVLILGIGCGLLGVLFNRSLLWAQTRALGVATRVPRWTHPGVAAAACGLAAWWIPLVAGGGHSVADALLVDHLRLTLVGLTVLLVVKFGLTVISYASGAPGGIFAPMLLFGAIVGTLAGHAAGRFVPSLAGFVPAFAVIGMAATFSGSVRAPLTGMVLILEMTSNYEQLLALGVASLAAYFTAEALHDVPIYEALLAADLARNKLPGQAPHADEQPRSVVIGIHRATALDNRSIRQAGFPAGCLVVGLERGGRELLPTPNFQFHPGDHLTVLVPAGEPEKALRIVEMATVALPSSFPVPATTA